MKHIIISILLLSACAIETVPEEPADYNKARRVTVDAWEEVFGDVSQECAKYAKSFLVVEVNDIKEREDQHGTVIGRTFLPAKQVHILIDRDTWQKEDTAVHEYAHILADCELGDPDAGHMNHRLWSDYGTETVEAIGCAGL